MAIIYKELKNNEIEKFQETLDRIANEVHRSYSVLIDPKLYKRFQKLIDLGLSPPPFYCSVSVNLRVEQEESKLRDRI